MEPDIHQLAVLFRNLSTQLRGSLSTFHLAAGQLAPPARRKEDPALDDRAAVLDQSYYQLLRLVNDLSSVASLYSGEPLPLSDCDVSELVGTVCQEAQPAAELLGIRLQVSCQPSLICSAHPESLSQLLFHLLSNAFKFTPEGGTVSVSLTGSEKYLLLSVLDTGEGIRETLLPSLFDRYLSEEIAHAKDGFGLGLALCRAIAEAHGGSLVAESQPGSGTRFTLSLPNRRTGALTVSDVPGLYRSTFNRTLMELSDVLPARAFRLRDS